MNCCPDRCDIEFEYDWKYTNMCMNYLVDNPPYFLNANDKLNLTLKEDAFDHVYLVSEKGKVELTKDNLTWSGIIPSSWTQIGSFQVIVERSGRKTLLYQGMLNNERFGGNTSASTGSLHQDFELVITPDDFDSENSSSSQSAFKVGSDIEAKAKNMFNWIDNNRSSVINIQCYAEYDVKQIDAYNNFSTHASVNGGELTKQVMPVNDVVITYDILSVQCSGFSTMALSTDDTKGSIVLTWQIMKVTQEGEKEEGNLEMYIITNALIESFLKPREKLKDGEDYTLKLKFRLFYIED